MSRRKQPNPNKVKRFHKRNQPLVQIQEVILQRHDGQQRRWQRRHLRSYDLLVRNLRAKRSFSRVCVCVCVCVRVAVSLLWSLNASLRHLNASEVSRRRRESHGDVQS
ncbi:hypothetical protein F2P81_019689 [Scophthalmus maximus]|uniref:Uncharacterized protein n=1 Tax=Scophthalmus maximus TaxID=52904 RepID=A0A6A4SDF4_SCOMX|nr:hypothetical protein F2P81_019689 [Scophthalmus maximus]